MIKAMLPVAMKSEGDRARLEFSAVSAAIAGSFAKNGAKPFLDALAKTDTKEGADKGKGAGKSEASKMLDILKRMGGVTKGKKR